MDELQQAQSGLHRRHQERHQALPPLRCTVVFGSVIMKKMKSWYMGPVIGATSAGQGWPVTAARSTEKARNDAT